MASATFDTLKFVETLEEAGIPETHARAISNAVRNAHDTAELATKTDLREAVAEVRGEIQELRGGMRAEMQGLRGDMQAEMQHQGTSLRSDIQRLDARIDKLELQLTVRLGGLVVVALGAFTALSKWIA
jgi:polyhydroxyalkanoate synthesis regulator phasin